MRGCPVHSGRESENKGRRDRLFEPISSSKGRNNRVDVMPQCGEGGKRGAGLIPYAWASKKSLRSDHGEALSKDGVSLFSVRGKTGKGVEGAERVSSGNVGHALRLVCCRKNNTASCQVCVICQKKGSRSSSTSPALRAVKLRRTDAQGCHLHTSNRLYAHRDRDAAPALQRRTPRA